MHSARLECPVAMVPWLAALGVADANAATNSGRESVDDETGIDPGDLNDGDGDGDDDGDTVDCEAVDVDVDFGVGVGRLPWLQCGRSTKRESMWYKVTPFGNVQYTNGKFLDLQGSALSEVGTRGLNQHVTVKVGPGLVGGRFMLSLQGCY